MDVDPVALHLRQTPRPVVAFDPGPLLYRQEEVITPMKPTVGRIVHYVSHGTPIRGDGSQAYTKECRAAIVTVVHGPAINPATLEDSDMWDVGLCVLNPTGMFFHEHCVQMEHARNGGTWHWPERETESAPPGKGGA